MRYGDEAILNDFFNKKMNEIKNSKEYKQLTDSQKIRLESQLKNAVTNKGMESYPICQANGAKSTNKSELNRFRGIGYDHIVDDGLNKGLTAGEVALNILNEMPKDEIERRQAINYMVNYANGLR